MYTYIDFVMEEHYFLGLPCLLYIFLKVSSTLMIIVSSSHVDHISAEMAAAAGPKRTRQTYTRYQTLELEKVRASNPGSVACAWSGHSHLYSHKSRGKCWNTIDRHNPLNNLLKTYIYAMYTTSHEGEDF